MINIVGAQFPTEAKFMTRRSLLVAVVTLCAFCLCLPGATIFSEDFDELTPQLGVTSAGLFQAISGTNIDIVGAANGFGALCASPESLVCVDLDGTGGNSMGDLQTTTAITLSPGIDYFLSFDLIGSGRGVTTNTRVTFGSYDQTFTLTSLDRTDGIVSNALVTVSAVTPAFLTFQSLTSGNIGAVLDNVVITTAQAGSVPEPSAVFLVAPALLMIPLLKRRIRNHRQS